MIVMDNWIKIFCTYRVINSNTLNLASPYEPDQVFLRIKGFKAQPSVRVLRQLTPRVAFMGVCVCVCYDSGPLLSITWVLLFITTI